MDIDRFIGDCAELIHDSVEHNGKLVDMVLVNTKDENESLAYAYSEQEEMIEIRPHTKEKEAIWSIPEWDFNFDSYLFEQLETGYEIGMITPDMHYNIWCSLNELFPEELNNLEGVKKYLQYCKENNITKEFLDKELNLDTPDVMKFLTMEPLQLDEVIQYKGYYATVDDRNYDNPRESIVFIYKSKQDYIDGNYIEQISLKNDNMKNYIKEYIDDNYEPEINEESYITFVLGYDLLRTMIDKSTVKECDINYEFCNNTAKEFMESKEYTDTNYSMYEMLEKWINKNNLSIQEKYNDFTGNTDIRNRVLDNDIFVMDLGYRNSQPVALIEKNATSNKEYIIAFSYRIQDNKMDWAYGKYYDDNIEQAKQDFKKVISGGDVADSFKNKESER